MSFILSALRKAEQERKRESQTDVDQWDATDWNTLDSSKPEKQPMVFVVATLIALSLCILVLLGLLLRNDDSPAEEPSVIAEESIDTESLPFESSVPSSTSASVPSTQAEERVAESYVAPNAPVPASDPSDPELPTVTGHLFFPSNTSLNRLFGVEGSYRVGHKFDNGLELLEITEYEAVFSHGNEIYKMPLSR